MNIKTIISCLLNLSLLGHVYAQQAAFVPDKLYNGLPFNDPSTNSVLKKNENPQKKISQNIFVIASINKKKCFLGEPVFLTYHLFSSLQSTSTISGQPSLPGFSLTEIDVNNEKPVTKKIKNKCYSVFTIFQYLLTPYQLGKLNIGAVSTNNTVDYYDEEGKAKTYSGEVNSNAFSIEVKPLPKNYLPGVFSGAVGQFSITDSVKYSTINANENDSLHIEISGSGNLPALSLPGIKWPAGFESFLEKEFDSSQHVSFPVTIKKIVAIPFICKTEGSFSIPSLQLIYFNPSINKYQTAESPLIKMTVLKALTKPAIVHQSSVIKKVNSKNLYLIIIFITLFLLLSGVLIRKKNSTPKK